MPRAPVSSLPLGALPVAALLAAACSSPVRTPLRTKSSPRLSVETCATLGETRGGRTCAPYDTAAAAFVADEDPLQRRALLYDRWLDLYNSADRQEVIRHARDAFAPGDPESRWADEAELQSWDDTGDSAGFGGTLLRSVLFRYAVTGTEADYQRFEGWLRGMVAMWDATGLDGYLARYHFARVPPGTPMRNGLALDTGEGFPTPARALARMPAYYQTGVGGVQVSAQWYGHTSIDSYSGPMNTWPLAFPLVRDAALRARMALHYGCFLKRLRVFKIIHLSSNAALQRELAAGLTSSVLQLDPGDPDLTKVDEVWAFYLPQFNAASAPTYPAACPAHLATDADPQDVVDAAAPDFEDRLVKIVFRQSGGDQADSMDFAYYPSVRAGDAVQLEAYALGAYAMTGDLEYLDFRDRVLDGRANARAVSRTIGAFNPSRPCRRYFRTPNVYAAHFMRTLLDGDDTSRRFALLLFRDKFARKEMAGLRDALFAILDSGASGTATPDLPQALSDLAALGGAPGALDSPRRNYAVDLRVDTPPGVELAPASAQEIAFCSQPVTILGVQIPMGSFDPHALYAVPAPPVMERPPDNWMWEKDPFAQARLPGDAGHQQYTGLDYTEPYWEARYFGFLPDTHVVLAWR